MNGYLVDSPAPSNLNYAWNLGSLLGICLAIQLVTGVTLAMHYSANIDLAFQSVEHVMRSVNSGWLIRYLHANVASLFFVAVYLHIGKALFYGSYRSPRTLLWSIGISLFLAMVITAFLGYVLPWGQMSLWGATVITNLMSAVPWIGRDVVEFIWGGFSVDNATLNRFYSLHYLLPFALVALVLAHIVALHSTASNNPLGISSHVDRVPFYPYYVFKDIVGFFAMFLILALVVFFAPNALGHPDNYVPANPMATPSSIVPEWYLLPFYAILRSVPNKLAGVLAMVGSILLLFTLPVLDMGRTRSVSFRPIAQFSFWVFTMNFVMLSWIGAQHPEPPYTYIGQACTLYYFVWMVVLIPVISIIENTLMDLAHVSE